jgi:O-antigen/teichoic acid export membrane protein
MGSSTDLSRIWTSPVPGTAPAAPAGPTRDGRARQGGRSDLRTLARGGSLSLVGTVVNALLGFVIVVVITRGQGAKGAGILFEAIALFTILSNTAELGADTGLVRMIPRHRASERSRDIPRTISVAIWPVLAASTALAAAVFVFAPQLAHAFIHGANRELGVQDLRLLAPFLPAGTAITVVLAGTRGFGTMLPYVTVYNIAVPVLRPLLVGLALLAGMGTAAIAVAWAAPLAMGFLASVVILTILVRRMERASGFREAVPARPRGALAKEFWRFSAPRGLAGFFQITMVWLGILMVGGLGTTRDAGIFAAVTRYVMVGTFAIQAIGLAIGPQISDLLARERHDRAEAVFQTATWWLMAISWPLYLALAVFSPLLLRVFGHEFVAGHTALLVLSIGMLVFIGTGNNKIVLLMGGKSGWNLAISGMVLVTNLTLNLVLIPKFGVLGAAISLAASIALDNISTTIVVLYALRLQPFGKGYAVVALSSIACYVGLGIAVRLALGMTIGTFALYAAGASVIYAGILWRFRERLRLSVLRDAIRMRGSDRADEIAMA